MFKLRFKLTEEDYWGFNKYNLYNHPINKKAINKQRIFSPLLLLIIYFVVWFRGVDSFVTNLLLASFAVFSVAWFFLVKPFNLFFVKQNYNRAKKQGKPMFEESETSFVFEEDSVHVITPKRESKVEYTMFNRICFDNNAIYLYLNQMQAYIFPNRIFKNQTEIDDFVAFLKEKINQG